jgi:uncharacterized protein YjiS (DUF1127 family)
MKAENTSRIEKELSMEHLLPRTRHRAGRNLFGLLSRMIETRRQRLDLGRLSEHRLKDIGRSKDEARTESERPVWDVPATWRR